MKRLKNIQVLALSAVILLASCGGNKNDDENTTTGESKLLVKLATVTTRPVDQDEDFTATVEAEIKNNIAPTTPVRIEKIFVEVGDRVSKGQKLVQMDQSNLVQSKIQLENLQVEYNRIDELYKIGGVSRSDWDAMRTNLDVAKTAYNNLEENTFLLSPINGIITARNYDNGDLYGRASPVLTVEQIAPVKLMINVSEGCFSQIKKRNAGKN